MLLFSFLSMKIRVIFGKNIKEVEVREGAKIREALKIAGINPETVIVRKGKEIVTEEDRLQDGDEIEAIRVISGG